MHRESISFLFKSSVILLSVFILGLVVIPMAAASPEWQSMGSMSDPVIRVISSDSNTPQELIIATSQTVMASRDGGATFAYSLFLPVTSDISCLDAEGDVLVVGSTDGLYLSTDRAASWRRTVHSSSEEGRECRAVMIDGERVYLGTENGLYVMDIKEGQWERAAGELGHSPVEAFIHTERFRFILTHNAVYRENKSSGGIEKIFQSAGDPALDETLDVDGEDEGDEAGGLRDIAVEGQENIAVVSDRALWVTSDGGVSWESRTICGIAQGAIQKIYFDSPGTFLSHGNKGLGRDAVPQRVPPGPIVVGTDRDVLVSVDGGCFTPVGTHRDPWVIRDLIHAGGEWVMATDRGLYHFVDTGVPSDARGRITTPRPCEPGIREIQRMAITYAEVHPEKISSWRRQARLKAFIPRVDLGIDRNTSNLWHWDSGLSPDVITKGPEYHDWDVSLTWELSDLVWSTDQTSIDSRSKMMVELRNVILDQVTRIYFERRRLQIDIDRTREGHGDCQMLLLRLEELTALLDGYTGGGFSRDGARCEGRATGSGPFYR